jgi:hypothetical protein
MTIAIWLGSSPFSRVKDVTGAGHPPCNCLQQVKAIDDADQPPLLVTTGRILCFWGNISRIATSIPTSGRVVATSATIDRTANIGIAEATFSAHGRLGYAWILLLVSQQVLLSVLPASAHPRAPSHLESPPVQSQTHA